MHKLVLNGSPGWELSFRIFRLGTVVWGLGNFVWNRPLSLESFRWGFFVWELSLESFRLVTSFWDPSFGNFSLGTVALVLSL